MKSGIYVVSETEKFYLAPIESITHGSDEDRRDIGAAIVDALHDAASDLLYDDDTERVKTTVNIILVQ